MVTLPPWLVGLVIVYVIALTSIFGYLFMEQVQQRRKAGADPVEQAYADTPQQQEIARLRALAAADAAEGPARVELDHGVDALVVEIYRAQTRARFKGIYGEDGQA